MSRGVELLTTVLCLSNNCKVPPNAGTGFIFLCRFESRQPRRFATSPVLPSSSPPSPTRLPLSELRCFFLFCDAQRVFRLLNLATEPMKIMDVSEYRYAETWNAELAQTLAHAARLLHQDALTLSQSEQTPVSEVHSTFTRQAFSLPPIPGPPIVCRRCPCPVQ